MITLALSKGRIFDDILPLLKAAGIEVLDDPEKSRKLILRTNQPDVRVVLVRATDVPTYVRYGGADMGVVGKDTLLESGSQGLYQPLDLQIAKCRISVAVRCCTFRFIHYVSCCCKIFLCSIYISFSRWGSLLTLCPKDRPKQIFILLRVKTYGFIFRVLFFLFFKLNTEVSLNPFLSWGVPRLNH